MATHKTNISLHTLTQADLNKLTRAFPSAKRVLAYPDTAKPIHMLTLEFDASERRMIDVAARVSGVSSVRFIENTVLNSAKNLAGGRWPAKRSGPCGARGFRQRSDLMTTRNRNMDHRVSAWHGRHASPSASPNHQGTLQLQSGNEWRMARRGFGPGRCRQSIRHY